MSKKKIPELRFKGFSDDWEQRKLGELADIYDGTHQTPDYKDQGIMFLSVENIKTLKSNKYISEEAFKKEFQIRPEKNDILMTRIGDIGTANVVKNNIPIAYYVSLALIKSSKLNSYFLQSNIHSPFVQNEIWKRTLHIAFPKKINKNEISNIPVKFPIIEEQIKIGNLFKQLDNTLALLQKKLDQYQALKKAFLQLMFPQNGESVPQVRFAHFSSQWEQRKLDQLVDRVKSYSLSRDVETNDYTGYKYVHYGDIHTKIADRINENSKLPNIKKGNYVFLEKGDLILADASEDYQGIATPAIVTIDTPYKLVSGLHTIALRPKNVDSLFLYYLIHSPIFRKYGYRTGTGMKVFGISVSNLLKFESYFPLVENQIKISRFLKNFDEIINFYQLKIRQFQLLKKVLLQKMFV